MDCNCLRRRNSQSPNDDISPESAPAYNNPVGYQKTEHAFSGKVGVIHDDVELPKLPKPANAIVPENERVFVTDNSLGTLLALDKANREREKNVIR
jgi:hypothetical protein